MTFQPASYGLPAPMFVSGWSWNSVGPKIRAVGAVNPGSGAWYATNGALYVPVTFPRAYDLQRFYWLNGASGAGTNYLQAALYALDGSDIPECVVSGSRDLSAGASLPQYTTPSVMAHLIASGTSTTDGTSFATSSVTLKARPGVMYGLAFVNSKASAAEAATGVATTTGGTVTFTSRNSQTYGASTEGRVSLWTAVPTADVTDTITITFSGTQTGCAWALIAFTNVDTTTDHGVVQTAVGSGNSTTPLATLGAFGSANNATFGLNANLADTTTTPGTGFHEFADISYATPTNCLQVQFRSDNDTTSDGTITSGQWGALAAEIKSRGTTFVISPGRYFMALWCNGTTATTTRLSSNQSVNHCGVYTEASLATGLPLVATPAGNAGGVMSVFGVTSRASP